MQTLWMFSSGKSSFAIDSCPVQKWIENEETWMNGNFDKLMDKTQKDQE